MTLNLTFHLSPALLRNSLFFVSTCLLVLPAYAFETDFEKTISSLDKGAAFVTDSLTVSTNKQNGQGAADVGDTTVEFGLTLFGRSLRLQLQAVNIFAEGARIVRMTDHGIFEEPATANTYRGIVLGSPKSVVAVSIKSGIPEGLILVDSDVYFIRPAPDNESTVASGELIALHGSATQLGLTAVSSAVAFNVLEIAAVADFEYFQLHGANASAQIASVINQVDAIYKSELETSIRILTTLVFETSADPFTDFNSGNVFNDFRSATSEFGNWRGAQGGNLTAAGLGHLFSNKFGINAGFGFIDVLCDSSRGASITTTNFASLHPLLIEHEFGHNFGAGHDGETGSSCASAPSGFIMAPSATGTEFSECSKTIIRANRDQAACIMQPDDIIFLDGFE